MATYREDKEYFVLFDRVLYNSYSDFMTILHQTASRPT